MQVILFTRKQCPYCDKAKELLLSKRDVTVYQIVLDDQKSYQEAKDIMISLSGGKTTVPQIFIQGKYIGGGYTGLKALDDTGELDNLFKTPLQPLLEVSGLDIQKCDFIQTMDF